MSTAERRQMSLGQTSAEKFLGAPAALGGPFALLGLTPDRCAPADVTAALDLQIARIDNHPQGETPEADDVRLALHAAAAQLLDQGVREQMEARWRPPAAASAAGQHRTPAGTQPPPRAEASAPGRPATVLTPDAPAPASREGGVGAAPAPVARPGSADHVAFPASLLMEARRVFASSGGWSPHARLRLAMLASARGVSPAQVPALIRTIAGGVAAGGGGVGVPAAPAGMVRPGAGVALASAPRPVSFVSTSATGGPSVAQFDPDPFGRQADADAEHAQRTLRVVIIFSLVGILVMAGAFYAVILLTSPRAPKPQARDPVSLIGQTPEPERPQALFPTSPNGPQAATPQQASAPARVDAGALLDELRVAIRGQEIDPDASAASFRGLLARAGSAWPDMPVDRRRAIVDAIVEYVYRASASGTGPVATLEDVAAPAGLLGGSALIAADDVPRVAWSVGLLVRLQRERDISARAGSLIEARLGAALEGSRPTGASAFDAGVSACLGVMPRRLVSSSGESARTRESIEARLDAWRRWLACVKAATQSDPAARSTLILSALETLIHDAPQPSDDRHVYEAMGLLAEGLDWSDAGVARRWLVRMLGAPSVDADDVHAITNAVATRAPGAGMDVSMVLPARATDLERRELRDRLSILWKLEDPADQDALASAWREAWRSAVDRHASDLTPVEHLASAIVLSRVSEAASLRWRGMTQESDDILADLDGEVEVVLSAAVGPTMPAPPTAYGDGTWAEQYLQAGRSIPIRMDLLNVLAQRIGQTFGGVDAEVLVDEALRGSPVQVQRLAYDLVLRMPTNPAVVNAVLEELPTIPKTRRNSALIGALTGQSLPLTRDAGWESRARRALVSRLLELLAGDSALRVWDEMARLLGWSYLVRAEVVSGPPDPGASVDPPEIGAGVLRGRWRRQGETLLPPPALGLTVDEIDRRRAARLELAKGPPQVFAAEQLAGIELMALVVAAEQPQRVDDVRRVLDDLAHARQRATHIAEQIAAGEQAGASLWAIRLKEGLP